MGNAISHGTANDENVIVQMTYDKAGRRVALRDPRGNQTTYTYDQLDRRISLSNPLDQVWTTAHSDLSGGRRRVTRTNPLGQQVEEDYDRLGRLVAVRYLNETPKHTPDVVFRYDAAGNRVAMDETLDGGVTWLRKTQYGYDGVGRLVSVGFDTNGDGVVEETVTYQYDAGGRRTQMTLPGNRTVQYAYDVKGQLVSLTDWDGQVTRYRYDNAGRLREAQGANLLTHRWRYDAAGRLRYLRHSREGKTLGDFAYAVDKRGNRTQVRECLPQAATGTTVLTHSSPAIDYLRGTWAAVGDFHETTTMSAALRAEVFGTELTLMMGTGPDHSVYDVYLNGTLRDSLDGYTATPGERSLSYSLTDEGSHTVEVRNRTDKNLASSGYKLRFRSLTTNRRYDLHTIQYSYDKLERLRAADYRPAANLSAAPFRQHSYAYDVAGNRTQVNDNGAVANYTYNAANQITNPGFSYDAAGRMTSDGTNTYTWDRADRLLSMGGVQNQYNGLGQRVQQSVSGIITQYLLDTQPGLWQVLASTTGADTTRYVHGPAGLQQQQIPDTAWLYPTQDGLGSVRSMADGDMAVLESRQYEPYGEPWGMTGTEQTDFGFTGEPTDANGLVYLRARHYIPSLGAFPSLDTFEGDVARPMSLSHYGYVEGNLVNWTDASGHIPEEGEITGGRSRYSCRCGWLDAAHIRGGIGSAKLFQEALTSQIDYASLNAVPGVRVLAMPERGLSPSIPFFTRLNMYVTDSALSDNLGVVAASFGLGMYMEYEEMFEGMQSGWNWLANILGKPSGFSEEDFPSDLVGYWVWLRYKSFESASDEQLFAVVHSLCDVLGLFQGQDEGFSTCMYEQYVQKGLAGAFSTDWHNWYKRPRPADVSCPIDCTCSGITASCSICGSEEWPRQLSDLASRAIGKRGDIDLTSTLAFRKPLPVDGWYRLVEDRLLSPYFRPVPGIAGLYIADASLSC